MAALGFDVGRLVAIGGKRATDLAFTKMVGCKPLSFPFVPREKPSQETVMRGRFITNMATANCIYCRSSTSRINNRFADLGYAKHTLRT